MTLNRAVFFDRDGTLVRAFIENGISRGPRSIGEIEYLPSVARVLLEIEKAGFQTIMISNQPEVARGIKTEEDDGDIADQIVCDLFLDGTFTCYHDEHDNCSCRKPNPGMFYAAAYAHGIDLSKSVMVGDSWKDIQAAVDVKLHNQYKVATNEGLAAFGAWFYQNYKD